MPVRLRIALFFALLVCIILMVVGSVVYYISYKGRQDLVKARLTLRVNSISSFYRQSEANQGQWIQKIDSMTAAPGRDKEVQVYNNQNGRIYQYSDRNTNPFTEVDSMMLTTIRQSGVEFFNEGNKDVLGVYDAGNDIVIITATTDDPGKKQLFQLKVTLWTSLMGGAFIALLCGYFFAGGLLRPVKRIADKVNDISAKNLAQRISAGTTKDEWHYLAITLNQLMDRLQNTLDMHRRFISNASHELSTPLASISNQLGVILQQDRPAEEYRGVMGTVYRDALHLSKLTQTLLEFAKTSGDSSGLEIQPVRVDEVLLELPAELARIDRKYRVLLEFENLPTDEDGVVIFGNQQLLLTAIKNIALNACKYAPDNTAFIRLNVQGDYIKIDIVDNGPGISIAEQQNIFQPFYRGRVAETLPGFGLGLSLALRIIKLHKGGIEVSAKAKLGTVFTILLPRETRGSSAPAERA